MTQDFSAEFQHLTVADFVERLASASAVVLPVASVTGSAGVYASIALCKRLRRSVWYVVVDTEQAHAAVADAEFYRAELAGKDGKRRDSDEEDTQPRDATATDGIVAPTVLLLSAEDPPWAQVHPDRRVTLKRVAALSQLSVDDSPRLVVTTAEALKRRVLPPDYLRDHCVTVRLGDTVLLDAFTKTVGQAGYLRVPLVEDPGTVAQRGGLFDVWPPGSEGPYRIELDGDKVIRIRRFDPDTQRTLEDVKSCFVPPCSEGVLDEVGQRAVAQNIAALSDSINYPSNKTKQLVEELLTGRPFFGSASYAPAFAPLVPLTDYAALNCPFLFEDGARIVAAMGETDQALERSLAQVPKLPHFPFDAWAVTDDYLSELLRAHPVVPLLRVAQLGSHNLTPLGFLEQCATVPVTFAAEDHGALSNQLAQARKQSGAGSALQPLIDALAQWKESGYTVTLVARATTQVDRLHQLLSHRGVVLQSANTNRQKRSTLEEGAVTVAIGGLARGAVLPTEARVYMTEEEVFGQRSHRHHKKERGTVDSLEDLRSLSPGDYVVHADHGIGRYVGLERRELSGSAVELIVIEYLAGKLYLPIYRLNQIAKYSGNEAAPKLDRLGGLSFAKTKARVQRRVRQMADELLRLYSERLVTERPQLPARDDDYATFEATFPFEETRDQATAILDVMGDLESPKVMDRLVCGDVGFGKTEVALRAAYRVAAAGRQVALLCPTTVLAQQHANNFKNRLADFGLEVRVMSRFTRPTEAKDTLLGLKRGNVDVVIGTHRLLSKDVDFKQLSLLIVDEEQRFGVTHKERIKQLRGSVDVLTLSATPIPRTLQMAVGGLRDLSMISTPPLDRRSIRTLITKAEDAVLVDAIQRELERGGQVFYVYNRVAGLEERAAKLAQLFPGVDQVVAHGQMTEDKLERAMMRFVSGDAKILISTAIIENGIDIPRANTLIVDRADLFGLSQLYQLRGRVGRSKERAYCYLLVPSLSELTGEARSRLEAIERFSELGSGLKVAALDLELRGAGDFLGADQSGFVSSVGFELFCHMLRDAADEARGEPHRSEVEPELSFDVETLLPEDYVSDVGIRLSLYKRLSSASSAAEVDEIAWGMEDRFGPAPTEARNLVQLMRDKTILRRLSVLSCEANAEQVRLRVREDTPLDPVRIGQLIADPKTGYRLHPDGTLAAKALPGERISHGLELLARVLEELEDLLEQNRN